MRFNEREIMQLGEGLVDLEGMLHYMKPQEKDWSNWYQQPVFKERLFKLRCNVLLYYRPGSSEPLGAIILENAQVAYERPHTGIPFAFSITFREDDNGRVLEHKYVFSCRCQDDVNKWVHHLKVAPYEHWRTQLAILRAKMNMRIGKNPVLEYAKSQPQVLEYSVKSNKVVKKSTFQSHIQFELNRADIANETLTSTNDIDATVGKLIDI